MREALEADWAVMSLHSDTPGRQLLAVSGIPALRLEELEFLVGEGPCHSASLTGHSTIIGDLRHQVTPWPFFGTIAREVLPRIGAIHAFPLRWADERFGSAAVLYARPRATAWAQTQQAAAAVDAAAAALVDSYRTVFLRGADLPWEPAGLLDTHWGATHRAAGALALRLGIPFDEALARMRALAFRTGHSLRDITTHLP
ncbi:ANTAR domain-containing protein [Streptomyces sp. H39-C1]|uniref:ANTAR domain-containing protein n=1 Tax=Streptomyces sp. H39-C1 TaxID=3004355 RepID=UPI0022AFBEF9|nr:ANTAR domain-containing protein [Streptomyces sp. H39-C1]MCZ4103239.1 ANTAR domain-containing protein [Streptomyces sp. H39-C1]